MASKIPMGTYLQTKNKEFTGINCCLATPLIVLNQTEE
jgi:hypothetical protein